MQLGYVAADAGQWAQAREFQERALASWRHFIPNTFWCGEILLELANIDVALGELERVPAHVSQALETFEHIGDQVGIARCAASMRELANVALTRD